MSNGLFESDSVNAALALLADGEFHSGEQLGALLGVSRAAVWKILKKFELLDIQVLSVKGRGYRIDGGLDLLNKELIQQRYIDSLNVQIFTQLDSTNSYLLRLNRPDRQVCLAESQTAGRGRRGRNWASPFARNLYLSIGWRFDGGIAALEGLSLAIGVCLVRALESNGVKGLSLKWPNDIHYKNKKLGGILIEVNGDPLGDCLCVAGIGVNVSMPQSASSVIDQPWINLSEIMSEQSIAPITRNQLVCSVLDQLLKILPSYQQDGFVAYRDEWIRAAAYLNQEVSIHTPNRTEHGVLLGVDDTGALRIDISGVEQRFHGGEISMRGTNVS